MKIIRFFKISFCAAALIIPGLYSPAAAQTPTIFLNGSEIMASNLSSGSPIWLSANQTLAIGTKTIYISVIQFIKVSATGGGYSLQFDSTLIITSPDISPSTVPAGYVWKVESVGLDKTAAPINGDNLGNHAATTDLNMSSGRIYNVANPTSLNDAVNATSIGNNTINFSADGGSANAYSVTLFPAPAAYTLGMTVSFKAANSNTGASTLDVNGLGVKALKKQVNADLITDDIKAGQCLSVMYDGTNFQLLSPPSSPASSPPGVIVMWSGTYNNIPSGWLLCDGTNGTPDLRNQFIYGVNTSYSAGDNGDIGTTGGSSTHTHTLVNAGCGYYWTSCNSVPYAPGGSTYTIPGANINGYRSSCTVGGLATGATYYSSYQVGSGAYNVTAQWSCNGNADSSSNLPPYYKLAFIMKQ